MYKLLKLIVLSFGSQRVDCDRRCSSEVAGSSSHTVSAAILVYIGTRNKCGWVTHRSEQILTEIFLLQAQTSTSNKVYARTSPNHLHIDKTKLGRK